MITFSSEQLNFFKFATVVLDEFPSALRRVFVHMWDTKVAPTLGCQPWDDSLLVRNMFLANEGGKTKHVPTDKSYEEWDCTALFEATLYAQSFSRPIPGTKVGTLADLYVKPRGLPSRTFHKSITSATCNQDETFALSLDQLRLLRNSLCHNSSSEIDKKTFDQYIQLSKDAFAALTQSFTKIEDIGKLAEKDFPTERVQQLENELRRETWSMTASEITDVKEKVDNVGSDMKDVKTKVTDTHTKMESVESNVKDMKAGVADMRTTMGNVERDVKEVKTMVANVATIAGTTAIKSTMESVGSEVKDVKAGVEDAKTSVEVVGLNVLEVKTKVTDMKTTVSDVESDVKEVKNGVACVSSDVKMGLKDVKTELEALKLDLKMELRADVEVIKQAAETPRSEGHGVPPSCLPDEIPHFYGRQKECDAILGHLVDGGTIRVVDIWGSPGFGKTSVAINIAHHLREKEIPVYFISLRGMKSKDEIVSRLLSIFADAKHVPRISFSHSDWLIQCLQQLQNPFVLILDNADDVLESKDTKVKDEVLKFSKDILAQCCNIKLLFTTRESLDFWKHELPIHLERVGVLDEISSAKLVKSLLPGVSENDCARIVEECGQVPLSMRLMCSIVREENVSLGELLEELKTSTLVEVLDNERFPDDLRLKYLINTSFQRLSDSEREAFVSLTVFPGNFQTEEAKVVLGLNSTRKILRALEAKSLIESHDNFRSFTIHSLLRSFIDEKTFCDVVTKATFHRAQIRFYEYNIKKFETATENFFTGRSNDAVETFVSRRESIITSLVNGTKEDELFTKTTQVLSEAELFLFSVLNDEESAFNRLYDIAVEEAQKRKNCDIERKLLAAKSFGILGWYYLHEQDSICPLQYSFIDAADCPPKLLCYFGIYELLCGELDYGISFLERFVDLDCIENDCNENVLMIVAHHVLAVCYRKKKDDVKASHFENTCSVQIDSASLSPAFCSLFLRETASSRRSNLCCLPESVAERDAFLFSLTAELLPSLYKALGDQIEIELSVMISTFLLRIQKVFLALFINGQVHFRVLETCCNGLHRLNCYKEAVEGFEMIASQMEKALGNHEDLARNYHYLALAQKELKEYDAAHCFFKRALEIRTRLLRERQETAHDREAINVTIQSLSWYVQVLENANDSVPDKDIVMASCETLEGLAAEAKEQYFAKDCFFRLSCILNNFSIVLFTRKDYSGALMLIHRSIKIKEENLGDVVDTVPSLCNEGRFYLKVGRSMDGENSFHRALDLCERLRVDDHENLAFHYSLIGEVFLELGKYREALNAQLQGLRLREEHFGKHHLTSNSFHEIGCTFYKMRRYEEAVKQLQKAVELRKLLLGNHTETALSFKCLFEAQYSLGDVSEAIATLQLLVCIYEALDDHENTAWCYDTIGKLRHNMGDLSGALEAF